MAATFGVLAVIALSKGTVVAIMHVGFTSDSESFAALPPIDAMWHGAPGESGPGCLPGV
jgi:hypothetical protein